MYINSLQLTNRINQIADEASKKSHGIIAYEEFIALPYYGNIILRFNISNSSCVLDDLDQYEQLLYSIVKDEFLIDFMGCVYQKVGVDYRAFDDILARCDKHYKNEIITPASCAAQIQQDAQYLLSLCGLNEDTPVWEIQFEEEIQLLILADHYEPLGTYEKDGFRIHTSSIGKVQCEGLVKAAFHAKRNHISLAKAMIIEKDSENPAVEI